jgi:hypothetical protein
MAGDVMKLSRFQALGENKKLSWLSSTCLESYMGKYHSPDESVAVSTPRLENITKLAKYQKSNALNRRNYL